MRNHGFYSSLLQHDLRYPRCVWALRDHLLRLIRNSTPRRRALLCHIRRSLCIHKSNCLRTHRSRSRHQRRSGGLEECGDPGRNSAFFRFWHSRLCKSSRTSGSITASPRRWISPPWKLAPVRAIPRQYQFACLRHYFARGL